MTTQRVEVIGDATLNAHTPGPWLAEVGDHTHHYTRVVNDDDRTIYYLYSTGKKAEYEREIANAHLISAAPDLLDVARQVAQLAEKWGEQGALVRAARAAIAKARGEQ